MNFRYPLRALRVLPLFFAAALPLVAADPDPYAPLQLYEGGWQVKIAGADKKPDHLVNRCARSGTFFSCEQEVNGKTAALVIFLPVGHTPSGALEYRNLALLPDASKPDDWGHLQIEGSVWTYYWTSKDGGNVTEMRNVNRFLDNDHIHFELQKKGDDGTWKTQLAGDEQRSN
jgi:hypothetical protein